MSDIGSWYRQLPQFTRYWLTATVSASLMSRFDILPYYYVFLSRHLVLREWELWRCLTSLFVYPLTASTGLHFMVNCFFIVQYSGRLEKDQFTRSPADYLYLLIIVAVLSILGGLIFNVTFLMDLLVVGVTYVWCQLNKDVVVNFLFGSRFKAIYLPWVLALMEFILSGTISCLIGIFIGHFYYFLKFQYPQELSGANLLETPELLKRLVPNVSGGFSGFGIPPTDRSNARPRATGGFTSSWGRGNTLGH